MRICVIGGGAVGFAVALFCKRVGGAGVQVQVVERDPRYTQASSALSASSIRQQFSNEVNIRMSQFGLEWVRALDVGFVESGYLFLASEAGVPVLEHNHAVQRAAGAPVQLLDPAALTARLPWLSTEGVALASLGLHGEGWFDGYAFLQGLKQLAREAGAELLHGEVAGLQRDGARITAARLHDGTLLQADAFVNAGGPWAARVAAMAGITLPVHARRRTVFHLECPTPLPQTPLVIDTCGVWFRSEGAGFLAGWSPGEGDEDPDDLPLDPDLRLFDERVWPALAERVPAFEALRVKSAWAGYYEVHPLDHNAILGPHPELDNFWFANGFSGHGLQHAPAAGRGLAERLLHGRYETLDLSPFGFERVLAQRPFVEQAVI
jgi:glycine/D-amino acid oxidase-like deaminating enzyme